MINKKSKKLLFYILFSVIFILMVYLVIIPQKLLIVKRVIDGDTIELESGESIRLIGIDTPETVHPNKPVEYFGKEASDFTKKIAEGKRVKLEYDAQTKDTYGRILAYVFLEDGTFLNAKLVEFGYAKVSTYPPNVKYSELFLQLQRLAREQRRGLWASSDIDVESKPIIRKEEKKTIIVYVTRTGAKYHRVGCRYLSRSSIPMSLKDAKLRYSPCSVCNPPR